MKTRAKLYGVGAFLLLSGVGYLTLNYDYSDGNQVGTISKLSHKGWPGCKTWEGDLTVTNRQATGQSGFYVTWNFSVSDLEIVKQLDQAQTHGKPVKVHYAQRKFRLPCTGQTEYFIDRVDVIE